jgi:hypothetical protein
MSNLKIETEINLNLNQKKYFTIMLFIKLLHVGYLAIASYLPCHWFLFTFTYIGFYLKGLYLDPYIDLYIEVTPKPTLSLIYNDPKMITSH